MIRFNFENCMAEIVGAEHGITEEDLLSSKLEVEIAHKLFEKWRATKDAIFFDHPFEKGLCEKFRKEGKQVRSSFDNLVILGIGGSALGLRSLANACLPPYLNILDRKARKNSPRLFVCDNIDPDSFATLLENINLKETCFCVISKSGNTTETISQLSFVLPILKTRFGRKWKDHIYIITDPSSGPLRKFVYEESLRSFDLPPKLGGRFSVLSSVGLFPAACLGIDIDSLIDGAHDMAKFCTEPDIGINPAYKNALILEILRKNKRKNISVMMPYSDQLSLFSDWYAQLFAESLGKEGEGMTPLKAIGTTDQHSQIQLYMDGPNDKVISFMSVENFKKKTQINNVLESFDHLKGHSLDNILNASRKATTRALALAKRPNMTVSIKEVNEKSMGQLFMFYEIMVSFIGALRKINPFDQPGVELGKKLTKEFL